MTVPAVPDLDTIRQRLEKATPGPWWTEGGGDGIYAHVEGGRPNGEGIAQAEYFGRRSSPANAEFIAHARTDVPALVAALVAVEAERDRLAAKIEAVTALVADPRRQGVYHVPIADHVREALGLSAPGDQP